ncbi:glycosyltransferase [Lentiprolixibacter aurantiacus]|uniref:Glycosyltransferase n=1 Tax=Lentiprolixibacter aurantiacus TaxID=2993939 RepID=A0AAE3SNA0_9FLAO|nr:glycosyltransferase [Lentiprolixibacter aurantiacus]MCX2719384.1 glycosyltransferase [Lentiprolixibacter aurantiacus]
MELFLSIVVPVFNRPGEIRELLESIHNQTYEGRFEVVIVEDGSTEPSAEVVNFYKDKIDILYLPKRNTGPGDSRNYGMREANGNYFILLDSDCMLPPSYLQRVADALNEDYVDGFGGPDTFHKNFSPLQKAINYVMTSLFTTGGIRGHKAAARQFQPRSFNMGLSRKVFEETGGFGNIHPGEDPDLTLRMWEKGFRTRLIPEAHVFHKRRIDFGKFYKQMNKFGLVRPILNKWHPGSAKVSYWFPSLFILGLIASLLLVTVEFYLPLALYLLYFATLFVDCLIQYKQPKVALFALWAVLVQFTAYGYGFLKSSILVNFSGKEAQVVFPNLFFQKVDE